MDKIWNHAMDKLKADSAELESRIVSLEQRNQAHIKEVVRLSSELSNVSIENVSLRERNRGLLEQNALLKRKLERFEIKEIHDPL